LGRGYLALEKTQKRREGQHFGHFEITIQIRGKQSQGTFGSVDFRI